MCKRKVWILTIVISISRKYKPIWSSVKFRKQGGRHRITASFRGRVVTRKLRILRTGRRGGRDERQVGEELGGTETKEKNPTAPTFPPPHTYTMSCCVPNWFYNFQFPELLSTKLPLKIHLFVRLSVRSYFYSLGARNDLYLCPSVIY